MFRGKKINCDLLLLALLVVHLRLDSEVNSNDQWNRVPETREIILGSSSAYTQINFHSSYSNYPHFPSKTFDDESILLSRLNYLRSFSHGRNLIAYYAPGVRNVHSLVDHNTDSESGATEAGSGDQAAVAHPAAIEDRLPPLDQDLSPEDMNLIEILWKQDIDLGVSREAFDPSLNNEVEKLKEDEFSKETTLQEFLAQKDPKKIEENVTACDPWAGLNYTVDSETGEYIVQDEVTSDEIPDDNLLDDDILEAISPNSCLPFNENVNFSNFTDSLPDEFAQLLPENLACDEEFLNAQIEDLKKELSRFEESIENNLDDQEMQNELFPSMEDCWQDLTTILPLSVIGSTHQGSLTTVLPRPVHMYHNIGINASISSSSPTPTVNASESFSSMLLQNTTLASRSTEETSTFQCMPSSVGPSSIGCAVVESMATLTNDTEPMPGSSVINTMYNSEAHELLYTNQTTTAPQGEYFLTDLLLDDDFQLMDMAVPSEANSNVMMKEDHMDTSSDSMSLTSERVPSISDSKDWVDSCSESSSYQGEDDVFRRNGENGSRYLRGSFNGHSEKESHFFNIKSPFTSLPESSPCAIPEGATRSGENFDMHLTKKSSGSCNDFLRHNHSYHLPFTNGYSLHKPIMRDKSRTHSEDEAINKDEKRAKALKLPISIDDIINLAIEEFNERLSKYELTEPQLTLIRDIRRRGKNKVAAQNCRKRKMDQISTLQQDLDILQNERLQLESEQNQLLHERHHVQDKYVKLYQFVLQSSNSKPPDPPTCLPVFSTSELSIPSGSDMLTSDDECDLNRGARTKRKTKSEKKLF